ncbi:MAG: RNA polymerase sigma factor SigJ [Rhodoglobus sp.]
MSAARDPVIETWWNQYRHLVRDVAYRVLGSVADAEDVVQDAYLRLLGQDPATIDDPRAWLVTVASRRAVDRLRAHEHSRRVYVGPWLPEPILADEGLSTEDRVTLDESVRMALLVTLERLSPAERTAFILHDVFQLDFASIAEILGVTAGSSRQLASRARRRVQEDGQRRFSPDPAVARALAEGFARACAEGDLEGLIAVLAPDVHGDFDHGGLIPGAPSEELVGADRVARQLLAGFAGASLAFEEAEVNGEPGVVARRDGRVLTVLSFDFDETRVTAIRGIGNPQKLRHLNVR